jgi:casein kinase II subunit beta
VFCPRCQEAYVPQKNYHDLDGGYFGCSFSNIFLQVHPELQVHSDSVFIPRIYGFKIQGKRGSKYFKEEY